MISFQSKGSNYRGEIYAPIQAGHHEFKVMRVVQTNWNQFEFQVSSLSQLLPLLLKPFGY